MPTRDELKMLQSLPLEIKVAKTQQRIREWVDYFGVDGVYVSFSGGKDSTVLLHIVRELYPSVEAVFVDTGLEYPEIRQFAKSFDNVTVLRPKMRFDEVIKTYGYPIISKSVARKIHDARDGKEWALRYIAGTVKLKNGNKSKFCVGKYAPLLTVDFETSNKCCYIFKETPVKQYAKKTDKNPITAQMAAESKQREAQWVIKGCNAFDTKSPISNPISFWTNQDILQYIRQNDIKIASVYGDIVYKDDPEQLRMEDGYCGKLRTTGCDRTGCIFCGFGAHLERGETRFQRLKRTHPKQYAYCIGGGAYDTDGRWKPNKDGLGMYHVFDTLNRIYGSDFLRYE